MTVPRYIRTYENLGDMRERSCWEVLENPKHRYVVKVIETTDTANRPVFEVWEASVECEMHDLIIVWLKCFNQSLRFELIGRV